MKTGSGKTVTVEGLVEQGNAALAQLQPELAKNFFERARHLDPSNTNLMDCLADVCLQVGEPETAFQLLSDSCQQAPTTNPVKWLYFAQLQEGQDALQSYNQGLQLLHELHSQVPTDSEVQHGTHYPP